MNSTLRERFLRRNRCRSSSGVALVIVLVMLTLVAILLVAFLNSASTELRSAKSYAVGFDARSLNDSAVNIVISQIQDATSVPTNAWASQPGMIRTYNSAGVAVTNYKLYSADNLRVQGSFTNAPTADTSADVPAATTWATLPDQYVDLNKPVVASGVTNYPIIDPGAVATGQASTTAMDGTSTPIQGCYLDTANTATTVSSGQNQNPVPMPVKWLYVLQDGTIATISPAGVISNATTANPIVGRVAFWTDDETCKVNVNTSGEGTFWDRPFTESPWANIPNTPATYSGYERNFLSYTLPAQNEFQRYPGHPAMTSLSVIFPAQGGETVPAYNERVYGIIPRLATGGSKSGTVQVTTASATPTPNTYRLFNSVDEFLFSGAAPASASNPRLINQKTGTGTANPFTDSDIQKARFFLTANSRAPEVNMFNKPRIALWPLQANTVSNTVVTPAPACWTAKDSLIAFCSTLGNTNAATSLPYYFQRYNSFDVGTVRTKSQTYPQSLTQSPIPSSQSPTSDWTNVPRNQTLFAYLQYLTSSPIPGLGGSLSGAGGKYATSTRDQILTEIMDFIRSEVTTATTSTTAGFPSYYYAPGQASGTLVTGERQVVPLVINPPATPYTYTSPNNAPAANTAYFTKGFGRFDTIQQVGIVLFRTDTGTTTGNTTAGYTYKYPPGSTNFPTTPGNFGAALILNPFNPTPGSRSWCENMRITISGLSGFKVNSTQIFPNDSATLLLNGINDTINATALMGPEWFFRYNNVYTGTASGQAGSEPGPKTVGATTVGSPSEELYYPFYTTFQLKANGLHFVPPASPITINIYAGYDKASSGSPSPGSLVQTISMAWPQGTQVLPIPTNSSLSESQNTNTLKWTLLSDPQVMADFNGRIGNTTDSQVNTSIYPSHYYLEQGVDNDNNPDPEHNVAPYIVTTDSARSIEARYMGPAMGDLRVFAGLQSVPYDYFEAHGAPGSDPATDGTSYSATATSQVHSLREYFNPGGTSTQNNWGGFSICGGPWGLLVSGISSYYQGQTGGKYSNYPIAPRGLTAAQAVLVGSGAPGDWDTGPGNQPDGPYINKPDESNEGYNGEYTIGSSQYAGGGQPEEQGNTYSPNRQICSAVAFGSLPTGIDPANPDTAGTSATQSKGGIRPWQTLLFCPDPASEAGNTSGTPLHPGFGSNGSGLTTAPPYTLPPDSAFLDFFMMPIVEPYAISDPFSTAGKVNMNYQIVPFSYLTRDTAVRAVLKSTRMMAIPPANASGTAAYKVSLGTGPPNFRYTINPDELVGTLNGFKQRFDSGDIFRSASEICNIYMVPQYLVNCATAGGGESISASVAANSPSYTSMNAWWKNYTLTGDNVREDPYNQIYPRLTTKSNTYTVHVWTQTLKKAPGTSATAFVDNVDQITSEYRGSYIIQRYLDPNSASLWNPYTQSAGNEVDPNSMVGPYKFRVVATKRFAP